MVAKTVLRYEQNSLGGGSDYPVVKGDEAVRVALLVDNIGDKRVYFSVYERISLEDVGVATVLKWGLALF